MRIKASKLSDGRVRLQLGYYKKNITLENIEELVQLSCDLNAEIKNIYFPPKRERRYKKRYQKSVHS